ncbi:hypothetical protein [Hymenobacter sp. DG01]|uniref:hypothetical protein n=1 Tax=Hymenobacter sp. DG01 TaxID=2584940 RepID=UPI0011231409|nr:hypothetical protein [Hymenobacter sp. DG01]
MELKALDLRSSSLSFNQIFSDNIVRRENIVEEIEDLTIDDSKLVIIEGGEGIGKTNLLLQFANKHRMDCFCYFINPASRLSYKQDYLMHDIGSQIYFYNTSEEVAEEFEIDDAVFGRLLFELIRKPKKNKKVYFILDGLDQIEKSDIELLKPVLHDLPWGSNGFYFIVSGEYDKIKDILPVHAMKKSKSIRVPRFTSDETYSFFKDVIDREDKEDLVEIHNIWKGHPDKLSQVKRILSNGVGVKEFLRNGDITEKNTLLDIEWSQSGLDDKAFDNSAVKLMCILAFDDNIRNINKISEIISLDIYNVKELVNCITFLVLKNDEMSFVSKAFRVYVQGKLKKYEAKTSSILIDFFTKNDDFDSVVNLPNLFTKVQDWESVVNLLSHDNIGLIVSRSNSFSDIKKHINYGYSASMKLKQSYNNVFKFSLYRSTINGLQGVDSKEDQIQAYVSLGKIEEALAFISSTTLKEDRVKMLISFVKWCKKTKKEYDEVIVEEIKELIKDIDGEYLKDNLTEMITGLAYFLPDLAVQLVEKASGLKSEKTSVEWLLGYIAMIMKSGADSMMDSESIKVSSDIKDKMSSGFADKFSKSIAFGINEVTEEDIINEISKIDNQSDRLYLLRRWIKKNKQSSNIVNIIEYAIELMLQNSYNVKPTTTMLLDVVYPILFFESYDLVSEIVNRVDELTITINSPSIDRVRLEMLLIDSISKFDIDTANDRALAMQYSYIDTISDLSVKVESLALLWSLIVEMSRHEAVDISKFILSEEQVKQDIGNSVNKLLKSTANHLKEVGSAIEVLAKIDLDFAVDIADRLNTQPRRMHARLLCVEIYVDTPIKEWNVEKLKNAMNGIDIPSLYAKAAVYVFEAAYEQRERTVDCRNKIVQLLPMISKVSGSSSKCYLVTQAIYLLKLQPETFDGLAFNYNTLVAKLSEFLSDFWNKMDIPWEKIMAGYQMVSKLADNDRLLAEEYFIRTEKLVEECAVINPLHSSMMMDSIRLMIRAYAGLLENDKDMPYDKITSMINNMPSSIEQAQLWSELAIKAGLVPVKSVTEDIVNKHIMPIIEKYKKSKDKLYYYYILRVAAAAIHLAQPASLRLLLDAIPKDDINEKERIISSVCFVLLTKCPDNEAYDDIKGSPNFKYQDAIDYINLISMVETDGALYDHIRNLSVVAKNYPNNFLRDHKSDITNKLTKLIDDKLPNKRTGVLHDGYIVAAKASMQHFSLAPSNGQSNVFDALGAQAATIDNIADKALVYSILSKECSNKKKKLEFLDLSFKHADEIESLTEKIDYYEIALESALKISQEKFSENLAKIHGEIYKLDDSEMFPTFRRLVDIAYKHDKNVAQKMISSLDTDPARKKMVEPASDHLSKLELEKEVLGDYTQFSRIRDRRQMSTMAWQMLGQLNANKRFSRDMEETSAILRNASKSPFYYSVPVFEFFLQSTIKSNSNSVKNLLLSFYDSAYSNAKLTYSLICSLSNKNSKMLTYTTMESNSIFVAKPGMRNEAISFIGRHLKESGSSDVYIVDPYFSELDFEFLKNVYDWCYGASVTVLTSGDSSGDFSKFSYSNAWREVSSEELTNYSFVKASNQVKKSPFHDRWIIMHDKMQGLRIGTSINSLGVNKISEVSVMSPDEVQSIYSSVVVPLIKHRTREYSLDSNDYTVKYESFDM